MRWFVEGDAIAEGERFIDDANTIKANDYVLTNFRAGLESERWSALLYVENALDQDTPLSGGTGPGTIFATFRAATIVAPGSAVPFRGIFAPAFPTTYFANLPDPRQVGLRVMYRFR